ncbi:CBS domain-containing protein [Gordonia sp. (in: high G+C Gram-positive bacteria)]|uniref:magnesium transporter MgtE N-terminal domain-containing protein n=1 Tax=Gordonia sp. (in: high G+C Gram-positive bacteria) TaxID=84139 RepID=UPI00169A485C|nr:CBS domain-containing protein [Gordonia sp. (in: high G+C Gram-positive bacteria)]NLG45893.1 CBS domain-containing protein [Gordonia sp. (in: high G+C Gram-positive bacteria)]
MTPALKVFVARLVGLVVLGPDGESIGRVRDVVVSMHMPGKQPRVLGLAVELTTRRRIFVPMLRVTSIEPDAVTLTTGHVNLRRLRVHPNEALAVGQLLDTRARTDDPDYPELHNEDLTVVDLAIERTRTRDWVVSRVALRTTRKGLRRRGETIVVEWRHVRGMNRLELSRPGQGVEMALAQFEDMRPADVANALRELPAKRRNEIAAAFANERLADVLQEMPTDDQSDILGSIEPDHAADVLEAMDPDDVADLMGELPQAEAEAFLARMDPEDSESVRRLLLHSPDTAGGVMTPEPLIVTANATVSEALARVRDPDINSAAASMVFVVRPPTNTPTGKFLGAVHTQALLREPPANLVGGILDTEIPRLTPADPLDKMARFFATYNLVCAPVIDEDSHLVGAVVVDDLLDAMLPSDWRETDMEGTDQ